MTITITHETARRYVLGKQGLWPGRRWRGQADLLPALTAVEAVQEDPLNIGARSQDFVLSSRVLDYRPDHLEALLYADRRAFEYGGLLFIYPMAELPYWRLHMRRRGIDRRFAMMLETDPGLLDSVRTEVAARGPVGNKDFAGSQRIAGHYRGNRDTSLALYHLWLTGELLLSHRKNNQRMYDLAEKFIPPEYRWEATDEQAEAYFARKEVSFAGLTRAGAWRLAWRYDIRRDVSYGEASQRVALMREQGVVETVRIEGAKDDYLMLAEDIPLLEVVAEGGTPEPWRPLEATTEEEAVMLAPLDIVSARGRARFLFDFDYVWEVYKPAHQRRWGYYVLPVLYGDRLVARIEPKLDRATKTMQVLGYWPEDGFEETVEYADALAAGTARLAETMRAERVALNGALPDPLASHVTGELTKRFPRSSTTAPPT
jgi:uncharacterized protein YcaQ